MIRKSQGSLTQRKWYIIIISFQLQGFWKISNKFEDELNSFWRKIIHPSEKCSEWVSGNKNGSPQNGFDLSQGVVDRIAAVGRSVGRPVVKHLQTVRKVSSSIHSYKKVCLLSNWTAALMGFSHISYGMIQHPLKLDQSFTSFTPVSPVLFTSPVTCYMYVVLQGGRKLFPSLDHQKKYPTFLR